MKNIFLVRHCKAVGQQPDAPLTEQGQKDADSKIVHFFIDKDIEFIISSPFIRAIETIKPLSKIINKDILNDERLKERVLSAMELDDWLTKLEATYADMDLKFEGGESSHEAMKRGIEVIEELMDRPERNIVVVTHGALLSLILKHYNSEIGFEEWRAMKNPDIYLLEVNQMEANIIRLWKRENE